MTAIVGFEPATLRTEGTEPYHWATMPQYGGWSVCSKNITLIRVLSDSENDLKKLQIKLKRLITQFSLLKSVIVSTDTLSHYQPNHSTSLQLLHWRFSSLRFRLVSYLIYTCDHELCLLYRQRWNQRFVSDQVFGVWRTTHSDHEYSVWFARLAYNTKCYSFIHSFWGLIIFI